MKPIRTSDGRMVVIAIDHAATLGALEGLEDPGKLYGIVAPAADAVLVSYGSFVRHRERLGETAAFLRCDGGWSPLQTGGRGLGQYELLFDACDAAAVGAAGVVCMVIFGDTHSERTLLNLAELVKSARGASLPVIGEVLFARLPSPEERRHAVRITAELGADIIKTEHPGDDIEFTRLCQSATVPLLVLGGARLDTAVDALALAARSVKSGAAGIAFGRNVWQQSDPAGWVSALSAIVHKGVEPAEAMRRIEVRLQASQERIGE